MDPVSVEPTATPPGAAPDHRRQALDEVRSRARAEKLGELVYDVTVRSAESRGAIPTLDEVSHRAVELGLPPAHSGGDIDDLLDLLARAAAAPRTDQELARLGAFFARGLAAKLARLAEGERPEMVRRLALLQDRLALVGGGGFLAHVDDLLGADEARALWSALGAAIREDARGGELRRPALVLRLDSLRHAPAARRAELLQEVGGDTDGLAGGAATQASQLAEGLAARTGGPPAVAAARPGESVSLAGLDRRPHVITFWRVLGLLTGVSLVAALVRGVLGAVLGYRRRGQLTLGDAELKYVVETEIMGRRLRRKEQRVRLPAVTCAGREVAQGSAAAIVGVTAVAFGGALGALLFGDGLAGQSGGLILLGLAVVACSVVVELLTYYMGALRGGPPSCGLELQALPRVHLRLVGLENGATERFLETLAQRTLQKPLAR